MSATVTIEIGGQTVRTLKISRLTVIEPRTNDRHDDYWDEVSEYEVLIFSGRPTERAVFTHRYGDAEIILVAEAIEALKGVLSQHALTQCGGPTA
jgi:hypothetical protein